MLKESKYSLQDVISFASKQSDKNTGIFISAAINKIIKDGDRISLHTQVPLDFLFYRFSRGYAEVDTAGDWFAAQMEGGTLKARKVGDRAFHYMRGGSGEVDEADYDFGEDMVDGDVKARKVGDRAFHYMRGGSGEVDKSGHHFGSRKQGGKILLNGRQRKKGWRYIFRR